MPFDLHTLVVVVTYLLGFYLLWRIPSFSRPRPGYRSLEDVDVPSISVIIPARNETRRIGALLQSLASQTVPPMEILVIDDHSTDDTASLAQTLGANVLPSASLPEGWVGKTWACWQGAKKAHGGLLLFLDADVRLERGGLESLLQTHYAAPGVLTVQPYHDTKRAYEELSAFFHIVLMASMNAFTPHGQSLLGHALPPSGGFGPCMLCAREDYSRAGGHQHPSVRGEVLESLPLARQFMAQDVPVRCFGGRGAVSFRMYPEGLAQLVEGWSKGFGSGARYTRPAFLVLTVAWITGCFGAFVTFLASVVPPAWPMSGLAALLYGLYAIQIWWILRRLGSYQWWTALGYPVPLVFFTLVTLRSLLLTHLFGRVQWHGRTVVYSRRRRES
jgi:4,4'-diaponeurosporenoate glycosyltransferase